MSACLISTYGTGISQVDRQAMKRAMLRFDLENRCYIEFYGEQGLIALTQERFLKPEDARVWIAIRFPVFLGDIS